MEVKVPSGMTEADLARPVVTVKDFETNKLEYELYSYGEETVVVPVEEKSTKVTGAKRLASYAIKDWFLKYSDNVEVDVVSENKAIVRVPDYAIAGIIGKGGKHIEQIEDSLGMSIDIEELSGFEKKNRKR